MRNHNHLLGNVEGVDGIKTGYIRASGFNIVTSVKRDTRHIVAVVFGGRSAGARDARMRGLIEGNIARASTKRTAPPVAEGTAMAETKLPAKPPAPTRDPREDAVATSAVATSAGGPSLGSTEPIKPIEVKTVSVQAGVPHAAASSALPSDNRKLAPTPANAASVTTVATVKSEPPPQPPGAAPGPAFSACCRSTMSSPRAVPNWPPSGDKVPVSARTPS